MKYGISACLTSLAVIAMLVSACGGGGGGAPAAQTPQAIVFVGLSTLSTQRSIAGFSFNVFNGTGATTTNDSAVAIGGAAGSLDSNSYDPATGIAKVALINSTGFTITIAPIVKIPYTWQSGTKVNFRVYSTAAFDPSTSAINNTVPIFRVDYFDSTGKQVFP